jgi:Tfp pilus assembly protein PilX
MTCSRKTKQKGPYARSRNDQGIALLVSLFALVILSLIGLALMTTASTEVLINDNFKRSRVAYYAAESGAEEARLRLSSASGANRIDTLFSDGTASTMVVYIRRDATIDPTNNSSSNPFYDPEYNSIKVRDSSGSLTTTTSTLSGQTATYRTSTITSNVPFAWVKVTRKTELLAGQAVDNVAGNQSDAVHFGPLTATNVISQYVRDAVNALTHHAAKSNPVYLVTAMGLDAAGSQRKILTELTIPPPINTTAAIDSFQNVDFSGNLSISGIDECNPTNKVYGVSSNGTIGSPNPSQTVIGQDPPPPALPLSPSLCPGCPFNYDVPRLINWLKNSGPFEPVNSTGTNVSCSGSPVSCSGSDVVLGTPPNLPPPLTPTNTPELKYYYSPGNLSITSNNSNGYGILLVDGDVTFHGGVYFEGIIIVKGTFNFAGGGGNTINIRGAVIAGESIIDTTSDLGGSIEVQYNSCSIANAFMQMPMTVITFKDRAIY